jgi:hypothetical protein
MKFTELPRDIQKRILVNNRAFSIAVQILAQASTGAMSVEAIATKISHDAIADVERMTPEEMMAVMVDMDVNYERSQKQKIDVLSVFIVPEES